jgi:hypothetical protein
MTKTPIRSTPVGKPIAEVLPPSERPMERQGSMADTIEILGDIVSPVIDESDWREVRERAAVASCPC